jgi:hypothetical protein
MIKTFATRSLSTLVCLGLLGASVARAEDTIAINGFATKLLGAPLRDAETFVCYSRVFASKDQTLNHGRKVHATLLLVRSRVDEKSERLFEISTGFSFARSGSYFTGGATCNAVHADRENASGPVVTLGCGMDCVGGGFHVALQGDKSIVVSVDAGTSVSYSKNDKLPSVSRPLVAGKSYRLDRVDPVDCLPLVNDDDDRAALKFATQTKLKAGH